METSQNSSGKFKSILNKIDKKIWDKNGYSFELIFVALVVIAGYFIYNELGINKETGFVATIVTSASLYLVLPFSMLASDLAEKFRKQNRSISKGKRHFYIRISLLIIALTAFYNITYVVLMLGFPIAFGLVSFFNSLFGKNNKNGDKK